MKKMKAFLAQAAGSSSKAPSLLTHEKIDRNTQIYAAEFFDYRAKVPDRMQEKRSIILRCL